MKGFSLPKIYGFVLHRTNNFNKQARYKLRVVQTYTHMDAGNYHVFYHNLNGSVPAVRLLATKQQQFSFFL